MLENIDEERIDAPGIVLRERGMGFYHGVGGLHFIGHYFILRFTAHDDRFIETHVGRADHTHCPLRMFFLNQCEKHFFTLTINMSVGGHGDGIGFMDSPRHILIDGQRDGPAGIRFCRCGDHAPPLRYIGLGSMGRLDVLGHRFLP